MYSKQWEPGDADRRQNPRVPLFTVADVQRPGVRLFKVFALDVSMGGAFVQSPSNLFTMGEEVNISLWVKLGVPVHAKGIVVWRGEKGNSQGFALRFTEMSDEARATLRSYVDERLGVRQIVPPQIESAPAAAQSEPELDAGDLVVEEVATEDKAEPPQVVTLTEAQATAQPEESATTVVRPPALVVSEDVVHHSQPPVGLAPAAMPSRTQEFLEDPISMTMLLAIAVVAIILVLMMNRLPATPDQPAPPQAETAAVAPSPAPVPAPAASPTPTPQVCELGGMKYQHLQGGCQGQLLLRCRNGNWEEERLCPDGTECREGYQGGCFIPPSPQPSPAPVMATVAVTAVATATPEPEVAVMAPPATPTKPVIVEPTCKTPQGDITLTESVCVGENMLVECHIWPNGQALRNNRWCPEEKAGQKCEMVGEKQAVCR